MRYGIAVIAVVLLIGLPTSALAHAGPLLSDPMAGATLGATPTVVRLAFSERPEPALSVIRVLDAGGRTYQTGPPEPVPGDPLSLSVHVRELGRGVYTVNWRIVSAVDGHVTGGSYAFGVGVAPNASSLSTTISPASWLEIVARLIVIVGLVALLGAALAGVARYGGNRELGLAVSGWLLTLIGIVLLADAQWRAATTSLAVFLRSSVGHAVIWRFIAIGVAGSALLAGRSSVHRQQLFAYRIAMSVVALAALAAIAAHVGAGHAGAGSGWARFVNLGAQTAHFAAAGVWFGGLAALLTGIRGAPSAEKTASVRAFSNIAAISLVIVVVTGLSRTLGEVSSWTDLVSTGYGRAVGTKIVLIVAIAALGALNRWRSVPAAPVDLGPLRRTGANELTLTAVAFLAAAVLGTLAPPAAAAAQGIVASGTDFATTVRVTLTIVSDQPGPNRFTAEITDYDTKKPANATSVTLQFVPIDDPGVEPTSLALTAGPNDTYTGSGANLAFDGRWRITARITRAGRTVDVPIDVEIVGPERHVSIERSPGLLPNYTVEVAGVGLVLIIPDPERAGPNKVTVKCYDILQEPRPIDSIVITAATGGRAPRQLDVRRLSGNVFETDIAFEPGRNSIAVIAHAAIDGARMRVTLNLDIPRE